MNLSSKLGICILKALGFTFPQGEVELENLAEDAAQPNKSADFLTSYNGKNILVEVKLKEPDSQTYKERENILESGKVYESKPYKHRNSSIETIVRDANNQLEISKQQHNSDFNILLFIAASYDSDIHTHQLINSLYGLVELANINTRILKKCYFYYPNEFARRESIDCVLIAQINKSELFQPNTNNPHSFNSEELSLTLCLNPFSEKIEIINNDFLASLASKLNDKNLTIKVINPTEEIENNNAFCLTPEDWKELEEPLSNLKKREKRIYKNVSF